MRPETSGPKSTFVGCENVTQKASPCGAEKGDVCLIKDDNKDRNKWKLGIVEELIVGRDWGCESCEASRRQELSGESCAAVVSTGAVL